MRQEEVVDNAAGEVDLTGDNVLRRQAAGASGQRKLLCDGEVDDHLRAVAVVGVTGGTLQLPLPCGG